VELGAVVLVAFAVEGTIGFGATVVTVALGAFLLPIEALLPAFVPVNMVLSLYLAARYRRDVDRRLLLARVLPLMGLGLPLGLYAAKSLGSAGLRVGFGAFVALLSAFELYSARALRGPASRAPGRLAGGALLLAAGVVHGLFGTGGPLAVYVAGREMTDKARFRATLSALWLLLNTALVASFAADGRVGGASLTITAALFPSLLAGLLLGELAHRRVPAGLFRTLVFALLLCAGLLLMARAVPELQRPPLGS
jgi:uncharacterized membrane protein YfcA